MGDGPERSGLSLAAILREYEIPTIVGDGPNDANAFASTFYPATPDPSSQEVMLPRLVKAGNGPVTISLLGGKLALLISPMFLLACLILWLALIWTAWQNQRIMLPLIGHMAEKQA